MSKGSIRRKRDVKEQDFASRWEQAFGKGTATDIEGLLRAEGEHRPSINKDSQRDAPTVEGS
jgi:hypothetical protein